MKQTIAAPDFKKPYYTIYFTAVNLGVEIRLNDIPVTNIENTNKMSLELPASEYIVNGINELKVITFPPFDDEDEQADNYYDFAEITVGLYVREDGSPDSERVLISEATIYPSKAYQEGSKAIIINPKSLDTDASSPTVQKEAKILNFPFYGNYKKQVVSIWKTTPINTPFPRWEWQDGQTIPDNQETYDSLLKEYQRLFNAFKNKDLAALKSINQHRSHELALSYHLESDDAGFDYTAIQKYINHPNAELYKELDTENTRLVTMADGRMVSIQAAGGQEPVIFLDYEDEIIHNIQTKWYKNKNGEWILIR